MQFVLRAVSKRQEALRRILVFGVSYATTRIYQFFLNTLLTNQICSLLGRVKDGQKKFVYRVKYNKTVLFQGMLMYQDVLFVDFK